MLQRSLYKDILNAMPEGIIIVEKESLKITFVNKSIVKLLGIRSLGYGEVLFSSYMDDFPDADQPTLC